MPATPKQILRPLFCLFIAWFAGPVPAAVLYVDADTSPSGNGSSWAQAFATIAGAVDAATSGTAIWIAEGTYVGTLTVPSGVSLYGGFAGIETAIEQRDIELHPAVITTNRTGTCVVLDGVSDVKLDGLTIYSGSGSTGGGVFGRNIDASVLITDCIVMFCINGGILLESASPRFERCRIEGNYNSTGTAQGGGINCLQSSPVLINCTITENIAYRGGGIACESSTPTLVGCLIASNRENQTYGLGGGIYCKSGSAPFLDRCQLIGNRATGGGGGLYAVDSTAVLLNCVLQRNDSYYPSGMVSKYSGYGGAVYATGTSAVDIVHCTLSDNRAYAHGGGIYIREGASVRVTNSILSGNKAFAIYEYDAGSDAELTGCLFFDNAGGDYRDFDSGQTLTGAAAIEALPEALDIHTGDPHLLYGPRGAWSSRDLYDPAIRTTTFYDSHASFVPHSLASQIIHPAVNHKMQTVLRIADNTTTAVMILGQVYNDAIGFGGYSVVGSNLGHGSAAIDAAGNAGAVVDVFETSRPQSLPGLGSELPANAWDFGAHEATDTGEPALVFSATSLPLNFGSRATADGPTTPIAITIANYGFVPLSFTGVGFTFGGSHPSDFTLLSSDTSPLDPGEERLLHPVFDPTVGGARSSELIISTADPRQPVIRVPLVGTGVPQPDIVVELNGQSVVNNAIYPMGTANFGDPPLSLTFTVRNTGDADLSISGPNPSGGRGYYISEGLPEFLAPDESDTFTVSLPCSTRGDILGGCWLSSNDPDTPSVGVQLLATIIGPIWVDHAYYGNQDGNFAAPYHTVQRAVDAAVAGDTIRVKAGSYAEILRITKPLRLESHGGMARIGAP